MCRRVLSRSVALFLVAVLRIELNFPKQLENACLFAALDVLFQRLRDGRLFRAVAADSLSFLEESVVNGKVGRHRSYSTHEPV